MRPVFTGLPPQSGQIGLLLNMFPFGPFLRSNIDRVGVYGHNIVSTLILQILDESVF